MKKAKSALISVFHKDGLEPIIRRLHADGVKLYSTGGTQTFIEGLKIPVTPVEELTTYPSILGGRVKTLHPKVFGGILARRDNEGDIAQMAQYEIPEIDIVIVDLYPFEKTVASGAPEADIIEKIDIGGISLIRGAAKNYADVVIVPSMEDYPRFLEMIEKNGSASTIEDRRYFAMRAFAVSSHYDSAIYNYFAGEEKPDLRLTVEGKYPLRYGENPHQKAAFYGDLNKMFTQLHGKELSYNNLLDVAAAVELIAEFAAEPTFAILKHNNACGVASRSTIVEAYKDALACDPVSAFGGVLIANREIDIPTANEIDALFCEVVIAPSYADGVLEILQHKKNRIVLVQKEFALPDKLVRSCLGGFLVQDRNKATDTAEIMRPVTNTQPTPEQIEDMIFASKICKHSKSNAIVLAKGKQLYASGIGQTSRIDALRQAVEKAESFEFDLHGSVLASDAYFPFADGVEMAQKAGIVSVIQPGGSIRDQLSIDYCNENKISMVFTGTRHFKH
ncbi:MAG: bifunctional phosphoribosylaminoimidazolecarboxamide formyltransferase/IMP cyclohydrolase [Flavobacteriales bacterium]|nr:bifunctional phosphoribosylaminoimidazolecarboxamide formyltransferase/IMP cyclohydrolase [Flavobacteriales bacterium]